MAEIVDAINTPTFGGGGNFSVLCEANLSAPPMSCLEAILDAANYPKWNTFCRKCTIESQPSPLPADPGPADHANDPAYLHLGTNFTLDAHINLSDPEGSTGRATGLQVTILEEIRDAESSVVGWRIAWKTRPTALLSDWMLRAERVQEFLHDQDTGGTRYKCWETFYGMLGSTVRITTGKKLVFAFARWAENLDGRASQLHSSK